MSKQPPAAPTASAIGPCPTVMKIVGRPGTGSLPSTIAPSDHPRCMHHTETMCHEQGRQLLHSWFLKYFPLTRFHIVNRVRAITPKLCPRLFEE